MAKLQSAGAPDFTPKALVWGAAGGIGRALVARLLADGWEVSAAGRRADAVADVTPHTYEADVADPFAVQRAVLAVGQEAGEVGLFIYAAGDIASIPAEKMGPEVFRRILDANLTGAFNALHYSLPLLTPAAPLVFLGAVSERLRLPGLSAYAAAKAGLEAFVEALRKEQRRRRVILVRPGAVNTPLWRKVPFSMPANALSPETLADKIMTAVAGDFAGTLDL